MKQNFKNYLKLGILLFGISLSIIACQKEDDLVKEQEQVTFTETITKTLTTVPYVSGKHPLVSDYFKAKRSSSNKSADNESYLELTFGVVDLNRGVGIVGESGSITFSFPVIVNEYDYQVFYNYIVKEDVSGDVSSLIRAYEMEASYATAYRNGEVDITSFTGQIKSYSTDGLLKNAGMPEENCPEDDVNDGTNDPNNNGGSNSGDDTTDDDNGDPVDGDGIGDGGIGDPSSDQPDPVCNLELYIRDCGSGSPGEENFHKASECGPYNGNGTLSTSAQYMDAWVCFIPERNNNPEVCDGDVAVVGDIEPLLLHLLEENPFLLLDIDCDQIEKWQVLAQHTAPQSVQDKISDLQENHEGPLGDWDIQYLEDAGGTIVNLDYFAVKITTLPNNPNTGEQFTADEFQDYFRRYINLFSEPLTTFEPYCEIDAICQQEIDLWNSSDPLGAVIKLDIDISSLPITNWLGNDGVVVCSEYTNTNWYFMTMEAPWDSSHPVTGTRQFGYEINADGSYNFFVRGVDRFTSYFQETMADLVTDPFVFADNLWEHYQDKLNDFVNNNGGDSTIQDPVHNRPDWEKVQQVLQGELPISELGCN